MDAVVVAVVVALVVAAVVAVADSRIDGWMS